MKTRHTKKKQGFTLVEMLIALAIAAIAITVILSSFMALSTSMTASQHYRDMHYSVRHAMDLITRDVTRSYGVKTCIASSKLELRISNTNTVVYNLSGNSLSRKEGAASAVMLATNGVKSVDFEMYEKNGTTKTLLPNSAYFVDVQIVMEQKGVRNTYNDELRMRSRMRCKGL